ncbi:hypothetical protein DD744_01220 [Helicobacter pylori]|nr:hypothetical protein DD744_01220 [Helicobacter pylori]
MIIKSVYRTHSLPFLDWYLKGLKHFYQTLKKGFTPLQRFQQHAIQTLVKAFSIFQSPFF